MEALLVTLTAGLVGTAVVAAEIRSRRRARETWQTLELRLPKKVAASGVHAFLSVCAGLPRRSALAVETIAEPEGITPRLTGTQATIDTRRGALAAHVPGARLVRTEINPAAAVQGLSWRLVPPRGVLRQSDPEALA